MKKILTNKKKNQKGFTLVELIVVIAIIGVLVAMMVPSLMGYVNKAKEQKNNANARTIASVVQSSNAALEVPIKGIVDGAKAKITRTENGDWSTTSESATVAEASLTALNTDSKNMISIDGSAYVEIDENGKVVKVIYTAKGTTLVTTGTKSNDTIGIWNQ